MPCLFCYAEFQILQTYCMQLAEAGFFAPYIWHMFIALSSYSQKPATGFLGEMAEFFGSYQCLQNAHRRECVLTLKPRFMEDSPIAVPLIVLVVLYDTHHHLSNLSKSLSKSRCS